MVSVFFKGIFGLGLLCSKQLAGSDHQAKFRQVFTVFFKPDDKRSVIDSAKRLLCDMRDDEQTRIINALTSVSREKLKNVADSASKLFSANMNSFDRVELIQDLAKINILNYSPKIKNWNDFNNELLGLIALNINNRTNIIIKALANRAVFLTDCESFTTLASRLIANNMNGFERERIIQALAQVPAPDRESFTTLASRLIADNMNGLERERIIQALAQVPAPDRESFTTLALQLIADNMNGYERQRIIENLERLLTNVGTKLNVNPADIDTDPAKVLMALAEYTYRNNRFPKISYLDSPGQDSGGLTRDLITRLFKSLCNPSKPSELMSLVITEEEEISFHLNNKNSTEAQIKHCEALGVIFAFAVRRHYDIAIGRYFHPDIFKALFAFPRGYINALPGFKTVEEIQNLPSFKKLLKVYLKTCGRNYFGSCDAKPEEINLAIDRFVDEDELNDHLRGGGSKDQFVKEYVYPNFLPLLAVAKSMHGWLIDSTWKNIKSKSEMEFADLIQGKLSKNLVIEALNCYEQSESHILGLDYLIKWITDSSYEQLSDFLWAVTGSSTMPADKKLNIHVYTPQNSKQLPAFHTCSRTIDLPNTYKDYETFESKLNTAIAESIAQGFTLA